MCVCVCIPERALVSHKLGYEKGLFLVHWPYSFSTKGCF